jgi:hypothetical protein
MTERRARGGSRAAGTVLFCSFLLSSGSIAAHASATPTPIPSPDQTTTYQTVPDDFNLTVSPTRLIVGPEDTGKTQEVRVVNRGTAAVHVDVNAQSFVGGTDGSLVFQEDAPYSAAEWVSISPTGFDLQPGTEQVVTTTIAVPTNPDLGDHQVALVFLVPAGESGGNIKVNRGVATPVYITVPGPVDESATVSDLTAPGFSSGGTVKVAATVENTGTVHRDFRGESALPIEGAGSTTFPDFTVVRGGERQISVDWKPPLFCICNLSVSVDNADGVSTTDTVQVIVFPVVPALILLGGLALVVVLVIFAYKQFQKGVRQAAAGMNASGGGGDG